MRPPKAKVIPERQDILDKLQRLSGVHTFKIFTAKKKGEAVTKVIKFYRSDAEFIADMEVEDTPINWMIGQPYLISELIDAL